MSSTGGTGSDGANGADGPGQPGPPRTSMQVLFEHFQAAHPAITIRRIDSAAGRNISPRPSSGDAAGDHVGSGGFEDDDDGEDSFNMEARMEGPFIQTVRAFFDGNKAKANSNTVNVNVDSSYETESEKSSRSVAMLTENIVATDLFAHGGTKDLAKLLECPICMEIANVPVLLCQRGHIVCNDCRAKSEKCPLCQGSYLKIRNHLAEELIKNCFSTCKFHSVGCNLRFLEKDKGAHEQECDYRPFECNLVGELHTCKNCVIRYEKFKNHILHGHQLKGMGSNYGEWIETATAEELKFKHDQMNEYVYLECYDKLFLCASEVYENEMMWWVYLVGSKTEAMMYETEINITNLEKNISLSWQGPIHSIRVPSMNVFSSGCGLVVSKVSIRPLPSFLPQEKKFEWTVGFHVLRKLNTNDSINIL